MNFFVRRAPSAAITLAAILGLSTLAGCNKPAGQTADTLMDNAVVGNSADALPALPDALPLESGPATAPKLAPNAAGLPAAPPAPVARVASRAQDYAYLDRAYGQSQAYGDAPPDYAFDYDGVSPWAWQAADDSLQFAEPVDGGYRYYYYEPGADYPYLIRDPSYAYGYSGGRLAVVYDDYGRVLDERDAYRRTDYAGRYLARARMLRQAASSERRQRINAENWATRRAEIEQSRQRWEQQRQRETGWRDYSRVNDQRQADYWRAERDRRTDEAQRFAGWQREGFRGPDPVRGDAEAQRRRAETIRIQQQRQAAVAQDRRNQIADTERQRRADEANRQRDALNQQRDGRDRMTAEQQRARADATRQQAQTDQQRQRDQALRDRQQAARQQQFDRAKQAAETRANAQRQDRIQAQQQRAAEQRRQTAGQDRRDQQRQQADQRQRDTRADAVRQRQDAARQQADTRARAEADQRRPDAARQQADRQREQAQARADSQRQRQQAAAPDRQDQARGEAQQRQQQARAQAQQRQQEVRAQAQQRRQEAQGRPQDARRPTPPDDRRGHD